MTGEDRGSSVRLRSVTSACNSAVRSSTLSSRLSLSALSSSCAWINSRFFCTAVS